MNNEKLMFESQAWMMSNMSPKTMIDSMERKELLGRINDVLNPEEENPVSEETYDGLNVEGETA